MTPSYKFTCYPYQCIMGTSTDVLIEHTITQRDVSRDDLVEAFEKFLLASGFHKNENERLDFIQEDLL